VLVDTIVLEIDETNNMFVENQMNSFLLKKKEMEAVFGLLIFFFFIMPIAVFFVFAIAEFVDLEDKKTCVWKTVVNSSTPDPNNIGFSLEGILDDVFVPARIAAHMLLDISPFDVQQIIYYNQDSLAHIVSYRGKKWFVCHGTETTQEWNKDLLFEQLPTGVHKGFWQIYKSLSIPTDPVDFFVGHSLGGAMCLLLLRDFQPLQQCIVFGCPRVGNKEFVNTIPTTTLIRYENVADIVCDLPPPVSPNFVGNADNVFLYTHAGTNVVSFEINTGSYLQNHRMNTYLQFLQ
jgi:hypothetical protein